jgi:hypothetical protein
VASATGPQDCRQARSIPTVGKGHPGLMLTAVAVLLFTVGFAMSIFLPGWLGYIVGVVVTWLTVVVGLMSATAGLKR